ncbi:hypothetical protein C7S17_5735 [Burkholderia thailandensis]|nr:hypothetical protein [Burkholderia thailandensis]
MTRRERYVVGNKPGARCGESTGPAQDSRRPARSRRHRGALSARQPRRDAPRGD